jgi:hypothetical protein
MCITGFVSVLLGSAGCATSTDYPRRPTTQEMAGVEGLYRLSDGYRAHIFGLDQELYVRIGAGPQKSLQLVAPDHYASPDGDVNIQFQRERADDDPERILVDYERPIGGHPPRMFSSGLMPGRGFVD